MKKILTLSFIFLIFPFLLCSQNAQMLTDIVMNGIKVDLREPVFENGILSTEKGGVIEGSGVRIQARKIQYLRKKSGLETIVTIIAEEDLIVEFNQYLFVGKRFEYDFNLRSGVLYDGRTALEPWYFGGERVYLHPDGSYTIDNAFVTTSENYQKEWGIYAEKATVTKFHLLSAKNVSFQAGRTPLLKLPYFRANLNSIFDQPIRYELRAGSQGPRVSVAYEIFSWENFRTFARFDYRLQRGLGGGFENYYRSNDRLEKFESISFLAKDAKPSDHHVSTRYRFQGFYERDIPDRKIHIDFMYDKLSDKEMATDYEDRGLSIEAAGRTQLIARKETDLWITNFLTRVRLNGFQTIKQELPTLETNIISFDIGRTGIIFENQFKASYLDFRYSDSLPHNHDYKSTRVGTAQRLYRPFLVGPVVLTPEIGGLAIFEGNSPKGGGSSVVSLGIFSFEAKTRFHKFYENFKHVMAPFARYEYYTSPTSSPKDHYIFDIDDGWYRLNMLRFGLNQNFYHKDNNCQISRFLEADIWSNAFFDSQTIPAVIPKVYSRLTWNSFFRLKHICTTAWNFEENQLDHINLRTEWTVNSDLAIAAEYRHRSAYDFRKADPYNFFIDAYRSVKELRHSQMSDRRDTFLLHFFYRLHPNWAFECESRHGWNRQREYLYGLNKCKSIDHRSWDAERNYNEYQISVYGTILSAWNVKLSYQRLEDDDRFTFAVSLGMKPPNKERYASSIPRLQF